MNIPHLHNNLLSPNPQAILYCKTTDEILNYLNNKEIINKGFTIRGGGHNHEGYCVQKNKFVIDISGLKSYEKSIDGKTVTVGAGLTNLEIIYLQSKKNKNRIVSTGECVGVGTAGYTLGGGWHLLCRQNGLSADSVQSFKIIYYSVSNGKFIEISLNKNSKKLTGIKVGKKEVAEGELFKIILGSGGGNFGIVTEITYKTFPLLEMYDVEMLCDYPFDIEKHSSDHKVNILKDDIKKWLSKQKVTKSFTSIVRLFRIENKIRVRIFARIPVRELCDVMKTYTSLHMNNHSGSFKYSKFSPYSISELKEYDELLQDLELKQDNSNLTGLSLFYQKVKGNAQKLGVDSYLGTPFYYELSHLVDSKIQDNSSNYSCRTPRKHKVTSTFIKPDADLNCAISQVVDYFLTKEINLKNYSICTFHTVGGKAGSENTSYAFAKNDFLVQIQSWLPENFNNKKVEKDMINWVNEFRRKLMKTGYFEGAFINFLNNEIPTYEFYNDESNYKILLDYKASIDPNNKIDSSPLSKEYQLILDSKKKSN